MNDEAFQKRVTQDKFNLKGRQQEKVKRREASSITQASEVWTCLKEVVIDHSLKGT